MSRYSVTVKIVQTWYEEIEVEASSEDGAEIIAELEMVQPTGEPVIDKYVYCNWMIKDTEPTPDEYDALNRSDEDDSSPDSSAIDIDSVLDRPKKSRRRSRRSRSKTKSEIDAETQLTTGDAELSPVEVISSEESTPAIEEIEVSESEPAVEAPPKRSRNRSRRSRSKARLAAETEQITVEGEVAPETAVEAIADIEIIETTDVEPAMEAPKKSRNRSRRSRSKTRQTAEVEPTQDETPVTPEIITIVETPPMMDVVETSDVELLSDAPKKSRNRSRRSRSKPQPVLENNQQQEVIDTVPEFIAPEPPVEPAPVPETELVVEAPKKLRSRPRKPQPKSQPVSEVEQPQETTIVNPEISVPVAPVVTAASIPDEPPAEKPVAPIKKPTTRKRKAPKSSDDEQGPQIGDDSFLGSDE
ncbi:MAG: hypothetical protein ACYC0V_06990 [Armatimonadota bacterium]